MWGQRDSWFLPTSSFAACVPVPYNKPVKAWAPFSPNQLRTISASCKILMKQRRSLWLFLSVEGKILKRPGRVQHSREWSLGIDALDWVLLSSGQGTPNLDIWGMSYHMCHWRAFIGRKKQRGGQGQMSLQTIFLCKHCSVTGRLTPGQGQCPWCQSREPPGIWISCCDISVSSAKPALQGLSTEKQTHKM